MTSNRQSKRQSKKQKSGNKGRKTGLDNLKLGSGKTDYIFDYDSNLLEAFTNKNLDKIAWTSFICTEFTSLCPKTGQPDFAKVFVNYIADKKMIESKSLKLYLFSFRNHGDFHEDCIQKICDDIVKKITPHYIEVIGQFTPRGGIAIFPFCSWANTKFQHLLEKRLAEYHPGKYTLDSSRIY